ncbi:tetratricopeptide repeat protein [Brevifollis gellanilyticus]|nr:tetratricopeptide repeat protein [Brevifollis gellanilyticus]
MVLSLRASHVILTFFLLGLMTLSGMAEDMDCLREFPALYSLQTGETGENRDQRAARTQALIGIHLHMTPEDVGKALSAVLKNVRQKSDGVAKVDHARARFVEGVYEQALTLALEAGDQAHRAASRRPESIIEALQLAAFAALELSRFEDAVKYLSVALGETSADRDLKLWTQLQSATARAYGGMKMDKDQEQTMRLIYTEHERIRGERDPETIKHHSAYAGLLYQNGRDADAERETRDVLKVTEIVHGPMHEQTQILRKNLARVLEVNGRAAEGEALRRKVVVVQMETLGEGAAGTLRSREQLVKNLFEQKKFGEAESEALILVKSSSKVNGPDSAITLAARISAALAAFEQGHHEQALGELEALQTDCVRVFGEEHVDSLRVRHAMGTCLNALKRYEHAEAILADVFEIRKRILPAEDLNTLETQHQWSIALLRQNKLKSALVEIRIVANSYKRLLKEGDPRLAAIDNSASEFMQLEAGRKILIEEQAAPVEAKARQLGENHVDVLNMRAALAGYLSGIGEAKASHAEYEKVLAGCLQTLGKKHLGTVDVMQKVAAGQQALGLYAEAEKNYRQVLALRSALVKPGDVSLQETRYQLGVCLGQGGKLKESQELVESSYMAVKDRKDVNPAYVAQMKGTLDQLRQLRVPVPLELNVPGTLQQPVSMSGADKAAPPLIGAPGAAGAGVPSADPASLIPSGTIQKPVEYKP